MGSDSTGASVSGSKMDRDMVRVAEKGKVAIEHIKQLFALTTEDRPDLSGYPQLDPQELTRLIALVEKSVEETVQDLTLVRGELYGEPQERTQEAGGAGNLGRRQGAPNQSFGLGGEGSSSLLNRLRTSQEDLANDDFSFELGGGALQDATMRGNQVMVRSRETSGGARSLLRNQEQDTRVTSSPSQT